MDLTKALARRIAEGDINLQQESGRYYVSYDRITAHFANGRLFLELWQGKVMVADVDCQLRDRGHGDVLHLDRLEGRMEITPERDKFREMNTFRI